MKTKVLRKEAIEIKKSFKELIKKGLNPMKCYKEIGKKFKRSERTIRFWIKGK